MIRKLNHTSSGFTLVELLVVIAIIATLAAILFPVFAQAKDAAKKATCLSNLKNIALAHVLYCDDYDGGTPPVWNGISGIGTFIMQPFFSYISNATGDATPDYSKGFLQPYIKNNQEITDCPSAPDIRKATTLSSPAGLSTYSVNSNTSGVFSAQTGSNNIAEIEIPSETIMIADGARIITPSGGTPVYLERSFYVFAGGGYGGSRSTHGRHAGDTCVIGWVDGHAKAHRLTYRPFGNQANTITKDDYQRLKWGDVLKYPRRTVTFPTMNISCPGGLGSGLYGDCNDWYYLGKEKSKS